GFFPLTRCSKAVRHPVSQCRPHRTGAWNEWILQLIPDRRHPQNDTHHHKPFAHPLSLNPLYRETTRTAIFSKNFQKQFRKRFCFVPWVKGAFSLTLTSSGGNVLE